MGAGRPGSEAEVVTRFNELLDEVSHSETKPGRRIAAERVICDQIAQLSTAELCALLRCRKVSDVQLHDMMIREALVRVLSHR